MPVAGPGQDDTDASSSDSTDGGTTMADDSGFSQSRTSGVTGPAQDGETTSPTDDETTTGGETTDPGGTTGGTGGVTGPAQDGETADPQGDDTATDSPPTTDPGGTTSGGGTGGGGGGVTGPAQGGETASPMADGTTTTTTTTAGGGDGSGFENPTPGVGGPAIGDPRTASGGGTQPADTGGETAGGGDDGMSFSATPTGPEGGDLSRVEDRLTEQYGDQDFQFAQVEGGLVARYQEDGEAQFVPVPFGDDEEEPALTAIRQQEEASLAEQFGLEPDAVEIRDGELSDQAEEEIGQQLLAQQFDSEFAQGLDLGEDFTVDLQRQAETSVPGQDDPAATLSGVDVELTPFGREVVAETRTADRLGVDRSEIDVELGAVGDDNQPQPGGESVTFQTEDARRAAIEQQFGDSADIEQVGEGAFEVTTTPPDVESGVASPATEQTTLVPFGEEGQQYVENQRELAEMRQEFRDVQRAFRDQQAADAAGEGAPGDALRAANRREAMQESQPQPRQQIEQQLEDELGVELDQGDVRYERVTEDGETLLRGSLTQAGEKEVATERAPGQGTPLEGVFEAGAGLQYEYEQFAESNVDAVQAAVPDIDTGVDIEETFNRYTPDASAFYGAAGAAAPVAVAEPTPVGELGVGGLVALGTIAAAGATYSVGSEEDSITAAATAPSVGVDELDVPTGGVFQDEVQIQGNEAVFAQEMGVPDQREMDAGPLGVPEIGITIGAEETNLPGAGVDELDVPTDGVFTTEVDVPSATDDVPTVGQETSTVVGTGGGVGVGDQPGSGVGESPGPDESAIGGEQTGGGGFPSVPSRPGSGLVIGEGGGVGFVGRRPDPDATLNDAAEEFFGIDLESPFTGGDIVEEAQQPSVSGDASGFQAGAPPETGEGGETAFGETTEPLSGPTEEAVPEVDAGVDAIADALTDTTATTETGTTSTTPAEATDSGFEELNPDEYAEPFANLTGTGDIGDFQRRQLPIEEDQGGAPSEEQELAFTTGEFDTGIASVDELEQQFEDGEQALDDTMSELDEPEF